MKTFIYKINQYLIERYPNVWNTRLVWMLGSAIILHALFFLFGLLTLTDPKTLQQRAVDTLFFTNGMIYLSVIISILLSVVWVIHLFKNNAFKNFYPTTRKRLFLQFWYYLLIIFSCSTFYLSYNYGMKTYISAVYKDAQLAKEINIANDAALFLSEKISDYTLDKRLYPQSFQKLYCETNEQLIDESEPYLSFLDEDYQFYSLYTKETSNDGTYRHQGFAGYVYTKTTDSIITYFYKDSVVHAPMQVKTSAPSYYNYSATFYQSRKDTLNEERFEYNYSLDGNEYYDDYYYDWNQRFSLRHILRNKRVNELLERNDKNEIKTLLSNFIAVADTYYIKHNLNAEDWFSFVYHPRDFEVKSFIRNYKKTSYEYAESISSNNTKFHNFYKNNTTDYYFENNELHNVFENIEDIKASSPFMDSIHFFMWFSFLFAMLIFIFRVTGLKPLLFTIVTVGVLALLITLLTALIFYAGGNSDEAVGYFVAYFILILGTCVLMIPIFFSEQIRKNVVAICVNISLSGFVFYLLLILVVISMHQRDHCDSGFKNHNACDTVFDYLEFNWSFVLFFAGLIFMYFYIPIIKKFKSLPEG